MLQTDSAALMQALGGATGVFNNHATGLGTARDPLSQTSINSTGALPDIFAAILYEESHLVRKIVGCYSEEGSAAWLRLVSAQAGDRPVHEPIESYLNARADISGARELHQGQIREFFAEASSDARLFGSSYLLLGVEDGQEWDQPIAPSRIKSLRWIEPVYKSEVVPAFRSGIRYARPRYYELNRAYTGETEGPRSGLIHSSRILRFEAYPRPELVQRQVGWRSRGVIDSVWKALSRVDQSFEASAYMLQTASMFTYALKGLSEVNDAVARNALMKRFQSIMFSMSVLKGIPFDADSEAVGFAERSFSGTEKILSAILDQLSIECDIPRWKLFEMSAAQGLGSQGTGLTERFLWAQQLEGWRSRHWSNPYLYLAKLAMLARDYQGDRVPLADLAVELPSSLQLDPREEQVMRSTHLATCTRAIASEILTRDEVRHSTYGGARWSAEITLEDEALLAEPEDLLDPSEEEPQVDDLRVDGGWVVWFEGRRTPVAVNAGSRSEAIAKARKLKRRGGDKVRSARKATASERKTAANGGWIRTGPNGEAPGKSKLRGYGPKPGKRADDATRAQKFVEWQGFKIGLQYRMGDKRHGRSLLCSGYGWIQGTRGADGMALDVYLGADLASKAIFEIEQLRPDGSFDEHKYVIGCRTTAQAKALFLGAMPPEFLGKIRKVAIERIREQAK